MKPGSVEPQPARDCFATLAMTTLDIPDRRRPRARMTRCHVWTAAFGQGEFGGVGGWSGAVMYPACWRGRLSAGPDGLRGSGCEHGGALLRRDDEAECRDPGPDHFAVAAWCSLRVSGRMARRGEGGGSGAEAGSFLCWTGGTIRSPGGNALDILADRDEPVGLAESRNRAGTLAVGIGGERSFISTSDDGDHEIFGPATLGRNTE